MRCHLCGRFARYEPAWHRAVCSLEVRVFDSITGWEHL
jgi:hypothetical protein